MRICICEDEALWRSCCKERLKALLSEKGIAFDVYEFSSGDALLFEAEDIVASIDILLQDISMPGTSGMKVVQKMTEEYGFNGIVVFLTESDKHYADAFDLHAYNYVEKNQFDIRFEKVIMDAVQTAKERNTECVNISCAG